MTKPRRVDRKIFQMNFGYRSLIDWSPSANWIRGAQNLHLNSFSKEGEKPRESQAAAMGMSASVTKIAGAKGFYYDVPFPTQSFDPNIFGGSFYSSARGSIADNIEEIMLELGTHSQQWLYLAAEKMAGTAATLKSETSIRDEEIKRIQLLLMNEDEQVRQATMETMKGARGDNLGAQLQSNIMKFLGNEDPALVLQGLSMSKGVGGLPSGTERGKDKGWLETFDTVPGLNSKSTYGEKTFRKMLLGIRGQWISQFAKKVMESGEKEVKALSDKVHNHVSNNANLYGGTLEYGSIGEDIGGKAGLKSDWHKSRYGAKSGDVVGEGTTVQEHAAILSGIAKAGTRKGRSLAIDIEFHKAVSVDKPRPAFKRADVTTEFFGKGGHHGVGEFSLQRRVDGRKMLVELSTEEAKKEIAQFYNKDRIPKYNDLMDLVMDITGETNMFAARQKFGRSGEWAEKLGLDSNQFTRKRRGDAIDRRKSMDSRLKRLIKKNVEDEIAYSVYDELFEDLKWVIHHMGNMLPGKAFDPTPYSNIMPVRLAGGISTLIVVFSIFGNGKYKKMTVGENTSGSYVHIEETLPLFWLYQLANDRGWDGTFEEFADMASAGVATSSLEGVAQSGTLIKNQSASMNPDQRLVFSKLAEPEFAQTLNDVSSALFEDIANNIQSTLAQEIRAGAIKYSVFSRNPRQLKEVSKWYNFAKEYLLTQSGIAGSTSEYGKPAHEKLTTRSIVLGGLIDEPRSVPSYIVDPRLVGVGHSRGLGVGQYDSDETKAWQQFSFDKGSVVHRDPYWFLWAAPYVSADWSRQSRATTGFIAE